jgi:NTP pyrophosphatase (non-canonical NTP hydrolase)
MKVEFKNEHSKLYYLAGLIDSDGNIDFSKRERKDGFALFPKVTISSKYYSFLKKVNKIFDNNFYLYSNKNQTAWYLEANSVFGYEIINILDDYLIFKKHKSTFIKDFSINDKFSLEDIEKTRNNFLSLKEDFSTKDRINIDWFAGFIDGDGSFLSYKKEESNWVKNTLAITYHEKYNEYFKKIIDLYGGSIRETKNEQWYLHLNEEKLPLIKELVDRLILKKNQALMMFYWISNRVKNSREYPFDSNELIEFMHEAKLGVLPANTYQKLATRTALFMEKIEKNSNLDEVSRNIIKLSYISLGLSEIGEIQGKVKKIIRDKGGIYSQENKEEIMKEVSDAMWYIALLCETLGFKLSDVLQMNLDKLYSRMERGKIRGSGDNR